MRNITPAVKALLIVNIILFVLTSIAPNLLHLDLNKILALHYFGHPDFHVFQLITHFFMHGSLGHIAFNMLSLYSIGILMERTWGSDRFIIFYFLCGIGGGLLHLVAQSYNVYASIGHLIPNPLELSEYAALHSISLGASGAVFGLFTAVALLFPNTEFFLFLIPAPIKAKYLWIALVCIDLFLGFSNFNWDNIGHFAHIGGVITGFIVTKIYNRNNSRFY